MDNNMSAFDPNLFLSAQQTEVNERRPLIPTENPASPDGLYTAVIGDIKTDSGTISKGDRTGQPWLSIIVPLKLEVPQQLQDSLGLPPQLQLTDRVFIDLTPDGRGIDNGKGRNLHQKAYRDALDMNKAGESFSWLMTQGRPVKVRVTHVQNQNDTNFHEEIPRLGIFKVG